MVGSRGQRRLRDLVPASTLPFLLVSATLLLGLVTLAPTASAGLCVDGDLEAHTHAPRPDDRVSGSTTVTWSASGSLATLEQLSVTLELYRASTGLQATLLDNVTHAPATTSGSVTFDSTAYPDRTDYFVKVRIYTETTGCTANEVTHASGGGPGYFIIDNGKPDDVAPANYTITSPRPASLQAGTVTIEWTGTEVHKDTVKIEYKKDGGTWQTLAASTPDDGTYDWDTVAAGLADASYSIQLTPTDTSGNVGPTATIEGFQDDFNDGSVDTDKWSAIGVLENADCGYNTGPSAFTFTGDSDREATTRQLDVSAGGTVEFQLKIGTGSAPCENADAGDEVELQYLPDGGTSWTTIATYDTASYPNFTAVSETIPAGAQTTATQFRWIQPTFAGTDFDHWAIDDVSINDETGFTLDNTDPSSSWSSPSAGDAVGGVAKITWSTTDARPDKVKLEYSDDNGTTWTDIRSSTEDDGLYKWPTTGQGLFEDDFNDGSVDTNSWTVSGASESDGCGANSGSNALYFDGADTRSGTTKTLDVSDGGDVVFHLKIGSAWFGSCENADSGEDIKLQYSLDGGTTWLDAATYTTDQYLGWTEVTQPIPVLAKSASTQFRWIQSSHSGAGFDNWAIDDVRIETTTDKLAEGEDYKLRVTPTDEAGNTGTAAVVGPFAVDHTKPRDYSISKPADGSAVGGTAQVEWSGTEKHKDVVKLEYTGDGGATWSEIVAQTSDDGAYSWDTTAVGDSSNSEIRMIATDDAGHSNLSKGGTGVHTAVSDTFDDGTIDTSTWDVANGQENANCGSNSSPYALWFNSTWSGERNVSTNSLEVPAGGWINFHIKIGDSNSESNDPNCEDADSGEGVALQYSTDGGATWDRIAYYGTDDYGSFTQINETIPDDATSSGTVFRWVQSSHSGGDFDHWAIDDVTVETKEGYYTAKTGAFSVDNTDPSVTFDGPSGTVSGTQTISWTTTDANKDTVKITYSGHASGTIVASTADDGSYDWDTTALTDGDYQITVQATDQAGNTGSVTSSTITVDNNAPSPTLTAPSANDVVGGTASVTWDLSADDISDITLEYRPNGTAAWTTIATGLANDGAYSWDVSALADGSSYELKIVATDVGSATGSDTVSPFTIDNTDPSVAIDASLSGYLNSVSSIDWTTTDDDKDVVDIEKSTDGGSTWSTIVSGTADDGSYSWTPSSDGAYTIRVTATDQAGNTGLDTTSFTYDTTDPDTSLSSPSGGDWVGASHDIAWSTTDANPDVVKLEYSADGGGNWSAIVASTADDGTYTWDTSARADGSNYRVRVTPTDKAGNTGTQTSTGDFNLDSTAPSVTYDGPSAGTVSGTQTISWSTTETNKDHAKITYGGDASGTITGSTTDDGSLDWDTTTLDDGDYQLTVTSVDKAGNTGSDTGPTLTVDNTAPSPTLTAPTSGSVHDDTTEVTWDLAASDIADITLDYSDDGGSTWTQIATGVANDGSYNWTTTNVAEGTYKVRLTATDDGGSTGTSTIGDFDLDHTDPTVSLSAPSRGAVVGGSVTVSWSTTDDHEDTVAVETSSDGGSTWSTVAASETDDGSYTWDTTGTSDGSVRLRVTATDAAGNTGADTVDVTVDNTAPTVSVSSPSSGDVVGGTVTITWSTADANPDTVGVEYSSDGGTSWSSIAASATDDGSLDWDASALADDDDVRVRVRATDDAGNTGAWDETGSFAVDATKPVSSWSSPSEGATVSGTVSLEWSTTDAHPDKVKLEYSGDGGTLWVTIASSTADDGAHGWDASSLADGSYRLRLTPTDGAGNTGDGVTRNVTVDNPDPIEVLSTSVRAVDGTLDPKPTVKTQIVGTSAIHLQLENASGGIDLDDLGATSDTTLEINLTVANFTAKALMGRARVQDWTNTDNGDGTHDVSLRLDPIAMAFIDDCDTYDSFMGYCGPSSVSNWPTDSAKDRADVSFDAALRVFVTNLGSMSSSMQEDLDGAFMTTDAQAIGTMEVAGKDTPGGPSLNISVAGPHLLPDGTQNSGFFEARMPDALLSSWGLDDPSALTGTYEGTNRTVTIKDVTGGTLVTMEIHYSSGDVSITQDTTAPVADAGSDHKADVGETVRFDGSGSTDNQEIQSYDWTFDDGTSGTGATPEHSYGSAGTYTATLTVTDGAGNTDTDTVAVEVTESTSGSGGGGGGPLTATDDGDDNEDSTDDEAPLPTPTDPSPIVEWRRTADGFQATLESSGGTEVTVPGEREGVAAITLASSAPMSPATLEVHRGPPDLIDESCGPEPPFPAVYLDRFHVELYESGGVITTDDLDLTFGQIIYRVDGDVVTALGLDDTPAYFFHCADGTWTKVPANELGRDDGDQVYGAMFKSFSPFAFGFEVPSGSAAASEDEAGTSETAADDGPPTVHLEAQARKLVVQVQEAFRRWGPIAAVGAGALWAVAIWRGLGGVRPEQDG